MGELADGVTIDMIPGYGIAAFGWLAYRIYLAFPDCAMYRRGATGARRLSGDM